MAGNPEQTTGYKLANVIKEKSIVVGSLALIGSVFIPALLGVAAWEGVQVVSAEVYKGHVKAKEKEMKPREEYALAA
ncbi:MAG: hypothetical protein ACR2LN_05845 [Candidatus Levyibacteriota bacterium]